MKKYIHKDFDHYYRVYDEEPYGYMAECVYESENTRQQFNKPDFDKFVKSMEKAGWHEG